MIHKTSLETMLKKTKNAFIDSKNFLKENININPKTALGLILGSYMLFNTNEIKAQVTIPIDSIYISYGKEGSNVSSRYVTKSLWEEKNGVPTLNDTLDFGNLPIGKEIPIETFGTGYGVNKETYSWNKWDTIIVKGKIFLSNGQGKPDTTKPVKEAGVNIFEALHGEFCGGNYLLKEAIYTNKKGEFIRTLRIKTRTKPVSDSLVTILNPNGGEKLKKGQTYKILFEQNYKAFNFNAFYSSDSGETWNYITSNMDATDPSLEKFEANWTVPDNINSDKCLIKIEDKFKKHLYDISDSAFTIGNPVGVEEIDYESSLPDEFSVSPNYPNPFNPKTNINYELDKTSDVKVSIYNILGKEIETMNLGTKKRGKHTIEWTPENLSSGTYFLKIQAGNKSDTKKMNYLK